LKLLQEALLGVIENGVGRPAKSDIESLSISGKTGTADLVGRNGVYASFCGYFPSDSPKYTCFVGVRRPQKGSTSGGRVAGGVFKEIAEKIYLRRMEHPLSFAAADTAYSEPVPKLKSGTAQGLAELLHQLNLPAEIEIDNPETQWIVAENDKPGIGFTAADYKDSITPNVGGMGARSALYALERAGYSVKIKGAGVVVAQSIEAGTAVKKGTAITIELQ
jgi:cell division protein FtsI (penicillin-binding protein 3)